MRLNWYERSGSLPNNEAAVNRKHRRVKDENR